MATGVISKRSVDAFQPAKQDVLWDERDKGFGLLAFPSGTKSYVFQYRLGGRAGKPRRYTIGRHGEWTPDQARKRAQELRAQVVRGIDPREEEHAALAAKAEAKKRAEDQARLDGELAFENVAARWLAEYELDHRPASVGQARVSINKYLLPKLRGKPMPHISKVDLQAAIDAIPAARKASRQQVFAYASILFRWALERGDITDNPVPSMAKPKAPKARDRVLSDDEVATVWKATGTLRPPLDAFYRLLILTGQRREEVAGMTWAQVDRTSATWIIPSDKAKNGVAHLVPLTPSVVDEMDRLALARQVKAKEAEPDAKRWPKAGPVVTLRGAVALSCFSQAKRLLDAEVSKVREEAGALPAWRVHDLRRTLATGLQRLGVRFEVTEAVLNHVSGARAGVAGIYQRHDWAEEKRAALEAWAKHIENLFRPAELGNVLPFPDRASA